MIRKLSIPLILILLTGVSASAEDRRDGNWWRDRADVSKLAYVAGFFDGMNLGGKFSYWGIKDGDGKLDTDSAAKAARSFRDFALRYMQHVTTEQLSEGLDRFYADYRNRVILITDAAWIVLNAISGKSDKDMQTMIEAFRRSAALP